MAPPIAPAAPVTATIWPASGGSLACSELGLLERPIFAVEHVGLGNRLEAADALGIADDRHPFFGNVGGDGGVAFGAAQTEQAQARHQRDAGQGIEFLLGTAGTLVVPCRAWRWCPASACSASAVRRRDAAIAADIAEAWVEGISDAEAIGRFESISEADMFDCEYWPLEQAKLARARSRRSPVRSPQ